MPVLLMVTSFSSPAIIRSSFVSSSLVVAKLKAMGPEVEVLQEQLLKALLFQVLHSMNLAPQFKQQPQ